jgi:orotidine-5'-phosphate decarboxylase
MLQKRQHGRPPRCLPEHIAKAVTAGQQQRVALALLDHFTGRATLQKRLEHQREAGGRFLVGHVESLALPVTHQPRGQRQGQGAARRLVDQAGRQAGLHGVAFPCRQGACEAEEEPTVDRGRIIDAIAIGAQASLVATQVQQRIPGRAVA